jgi:hypothetical protein
LLFWRDLLAQRPINYGGSTPQKRNRNGKHLQSPRKIGPTRSESSPSKRLPLLPSRRLSRTTNSAKDLDVSIEGLQSTPSASIKRITRRVLSYDQSTGQKRENPSLYQTDPVRTKPRLRLACEAKRCLKWSTFEDHHLLTLTSNGTDSKMRRKSPTGGICWKLHPVFLTDSWSWRMIRDVCKLSFR